MSYESQESSAEGGAPIELYRITGAETFLYTSSATPYQDGSQVYEPVPIKRTAPTINSKESSANISLKFPFNNPFVARYLGGVPPEPDTVTIFRVHRSDTQAEIRRFWYGTVSSVKFADTTATVSLLGVMSKLGAQLPIATYSWMCNHSLYDDRCGVPKGTNTFTFTVSGLSQDGLTVSLTDFGQASSQVTTDVSFFNGGIFTAPENVGQRTALRFTEVDTNSYEVVLLVPTSDLQIGNQVTITAGCDHSIQNCYSRFNNVQNYGGYPFIPTLNPFSSDMRR
jgi:uncharacterized phage protein (TIGR02218 family)